MSLGYRCPGILPVPRMAFVCSSTDPKWNKRHANPTHSRGDCVFWLFARKGFEQPSPSVSTVSFGGTVAAAGASRRYRRIHIPHSAFRNPHSLLPSPVAPAPAELTYESAWFFGENLFSERLGGVTQFSAFSVQTADDTSDCFGTTKSLGRFPQQNFQDGDIVIETNLFLQLRQPRGHLVHLLGPHRLQQLEFVKEVFHPDAPFVKGLLSAILK